MSIIFSSGRENPDQKSSLKQKIRNRFSCKQHQDISVPTPDGNLLFRCHSDLEQWRVRTIFVKEEGTIRWLANSLRAGDIFYDVGANIGIYSLYAARKLRGSGSVYAFEPHLGNAAQLLTNISLNELGHQVQCFSTALGDQTGIQPFNYFSLQTGSAFSQIAGTLDGNDKIFQPAATEMKSTFTMADLIKSGFPIPTHVKIDVDGNELLVLRGMRDLIHSSTRLCSVQVEVNSRFRGALFDFFVGSDFSFKARHDTHQGRQLLASGKDPQEIAYNAIFERKSP